MNIVLQKNVASLGALRRLTAASSATAASTGDSTTTTGATIDRFGFTGTAGFPLSLAAAVVYDTTLATSKTLSFGYAVQDSADGSTWADFQTATYAVVATGTTAASALSGQLEIAVDLTAANRYVRLNYATDLSATQTDTAVARAVGFFAGFDRLPA